MFGAGEAALGLEPGTAPGVSVLPVYLYLLRSLCMTRRKGLLPSCLTPLGVLLHIQAMGRADEIWGQRT